MASSAFSFSSSTARAWKYDVFLSFRGPDTRRGIVTQLYGQLQNNRGIETFMDDRDLEVGDNISPTLLKAIEESRFAIVVFSPNYAFSHWCLEELAKICECMIEEKRILPVFYNVEPSDVRHRKGSFKKAFKNHESSGRYTSDKVQLWKEALKKVASFKGWNTKEIKTDEELVEKIVDFVCKRIQPIDIEYTMSTGDFQAYGATKKAMDGVMEALRGGDVTAVAVQGMGGVGKTTMVKEVGPGFSASASDYFGSMYPVQLNDLHAYERATQLLSCRVSMASSASPFSSAQPSSSSTARVWKYDVFLSFRGPDTQRGIVSQLHKELQNKRIKTYMDDRDLEVGESISPTLLKAIEESRFAIVILSPNYASSPWCLDELAKICECMKEESRILPLFYLVEPTDVRYQKRSFEEAFKKHETSGRHGQEKLKQWREALNKLAFFSGWNTQDYRTDRGLVEAIVEYVSSKVVHDAIEFTGDFQVFEATRHAMDELMNALKDDKVTAVGVYGRGGVGKTTLVEYVSAQARKSGIFDYVTKGAVSQNLDFEELQQALAEQLGFKLHEKTEIGKAARLRKDLKRREKILIILDDIWERTDLSRIGIPSHKELQMCKSKVLLTTRIRNVCHVMECQRMITLNVLSEQDSWALFLRKARRTFESPTFNGVAKKVAGQCRGLPIALIAVARALGDKDLVEWKRAAQLLEKLQIDDGEVSKCIKLIYDYLKDEDCKTEIELLESIVDFECSKIYAVDFEVFGATKQAMDEVMRKLKDEKATVIGVYGAGGVGKTTMVKHVCAKVRNKGMFHHVITVVISKSPDLRKIQGTLADKLGLELVEETEIGRSRRLMQKIRRESRILIILDDMWERIDLCNIGLPSYHELQRCNSKVLLITRAHNVLHAMGCQSNIHLDVLSEEDSRKLFMNSARLTPVELTKFYDVANSLARECAGLPIALIAVAKALRGKDKWMEAGSRLCVSEPANPEYEKVVFNCIKLSYDYLASDDARSCFLLCCLFPEDYDIQIEDLLMYAMGKGLFQDSRTMQDARASAHLVVKHLRFCSLLLESERDGCVKMHDVVRDVATRISSSENRQLFFVQAGCQLKEWPDMGAHESFSGLTKQKEEYSAISLIRNKICKLPEKLVCPKLLILFLQSNVCLDEIPENFFQSLNVLRVLDLSQTRISLLPTSLALLINLHTLYLDGCLSITNLSLLGKLEKLEILSMRELPLLELPKEIGHLTNLRKLDITGEYVDIVPSEVISTLHRLEELYMQCNFADWKSEVGKTKVNGSKVDEAGKENVAAFAELTSLSRLNILKVFISEANSLPKVVGVEPKWINFNICVSGSLSIREVSLEVSKKKREVSLVSNSSPIYTRALTLGTTIKDLPGWFINVVTTKAEKLQYLLCKELDNIVVEYDHGRLHALKYLRVIGPSEKLEVLMNASARYEPVFQDLEELHLIQVDCLKKLCFGELPPESLCNLRLLKVKHCYELVGALLPSQLLQRLQNLEKLICEEMDELEYVFGSEGLSAEQIDMTELKNIRLKNLANLIKIWNGPVSCNIFQHLQSLVVSGCLELRNLFAADVAHFLLQLENLSIECCPILASVIEASKETMDTNIIFPNLKILVLIKLPRLTRFYSNTEIAIECPLLEYLNVERCPQFSTDVQLNYQQHLNIVQRSSTIINQREV